MVSYPINVSLWLSAVLCLHCLFVSAFLPSTESYFLGPNAFRLNKMLSGHNSSFVLTSPTNLLFFITPHGVFMDCKSLNIIQQPVHWESSLAFSPVHTLIHTELVSGPPVHFKRLKTVYFKSSIFALVFIYFLNLVIFYFFFLNEVDLVKEKKLIWGIRTVKRSWFYFWKLWRDSCWLSKYEHSETILFNKLLL